MTIKFKTLTLALGAAALLAPAAVAHKPADPGPSSAHSHGKAHGKNAKNAVFRGTVVSVDTVNNKIVVDVTSASKWGRSAVGGADQTFTVGENTKIRTHDFSGDSQQTLADFSEGQSVQVIARVPKGEPLPAEIAARKVQNKTPAPAPTP